MRKEIKFMTFIMSVVLSLAFTAFAQERTGTIDGTVKDQTGAVVPNATVVIEGNAFNRTVTSNDDGYFRVQQVPPGSYSVTISAGNFQKETRNNVAVSLGIATTVDTELKTSVGAVVNVTTEGVATLDTTSSKIQTDLSAKRLEALPKGNNFTTALKAAAPVREEPNAGGFQIDGASGSENSFVVDGQEVTNFRTGTLNGSNNLPFQLIQEVQVKSGGFEAEFGGATGGVINVVTKRGQDSFHGELGTALEPSKLWAGPRRVLKTSTAIAPGAPNRYIYPQRDNFLNSYPSMFAGGAIIKKRLYYFVSSSPQFRTLNRFYTFPDSVRKEFHSEQRNDYDFARLDGQITDKLQVTANYTYNPITLHGVLPLFNTLDSSTSSAGAAIDPAATKALGGRVASQNYGFEATYTPTQNLTFNARYGRNYLNEKVDFLSNTPKYSYGIPQVTRYTCNTNACSAGASGYTSVSSNNGIVKDISIRKTFDANMGLYTPNLGGRHSFKFGYQYNGISNDVDNGYVSLGILNFEVNPTQKANDRNGVTRGPVNAADAAAGVIGIGTLALVGTKGKASSRNQGLFAQDNWQIGKRLTLNLGVRIEKENIPSFKAGAASITFSWKDKLAPRLGASFDVLGNGKWKLFGSYGKFYDRFKYELPRGSFGGDTQLIYTFLITNPNIFSYTKDSVIANNINLADQRIPSNDPADNRVDPDLKPFQQAEMTVGTAYDFGQGFILQGRYTHKYVIKTIDDIGYHGPTANQDEFYYIGNPGFGVCAQAACGKYTIPGHPGTPKAERKYDAVEVSLQKRLTENFSIDTSYTYSRLFGNYSGSATSDEAQRQAGAGRPSPNVSRYYDLPFVEFTLDGKPNNGLLPTDRPHFLKVAGNYNFDWWGSKTNSTSLNAFYSIGSGTPVTSRGFYTGVTSVVISKRGDLGRTNTYSQLDMSLTHKYKFGRDNRYAVAFDANVLNVLNTATEISRRETIAKQDVAYADFGCTTDICMDRAVFNGSVTAAKYLANVTAKGAQDTRYNLPQTFQAPRAVRFGFRFIF